MLIFKNRIAWFEIMGKAESKKGYNECDSGLQNFSSDLLDTDYREF